MLGLSYESIKDYLSYYAEAFFLFAIDHFSYSMKTQKMNPSKIFCIDTGLRNAVSFRFSQDEGKLAENLVMTELKRRGDDVYYWKSGKQHEIDCVIKNKDQTLTAINITYTDKINSRECASLKEFADEFPKTQQLVCITKNVEKQEQGITYIPLWKWLLG
jgi:predicted AAA+ superfamily ATPase